MYVALKKCPNSGWQRTINTNHLRNLTLVQQFAFFTNTLDYDSCLLNFKDLFKFVLHAKRLVSDCPYVITSLVLAAKLSSILVVAVVFSVLVIFVLFFFTMSYQGFKI